MARPDNGELQHAKAPDKRVADRFGEAARELWDAEAGYAFACMEVERAECALLEAHAHPLPLDESQRFYDRLQVASIRQAEAKARFDALQNNGAALKTPLSLVENSIKQPPSPNGKLTAMRERYLRSYALEREKTAPDAAASLNREYGCDRHPE